MLRNSASIYLTVHTRNLASPWHLSFPSITKSFHTCLLNLSLIYLLTPSLHCCHPRLSQWSLPRSGLAPQETCETVWKQPWLSQPGEERLPASSGQERRMVLSILHGVQQSRPPKLRSPALSTWKSDAYRGFCFYISYSLEKMIIIQNNF